MRKRHDSLVKSCLGAGDRSSTPTNAGTDNFFRKTSRVLQYLKLPNKIYLREHDDAFKERIIHPEAFCSSHNKIYGNLKSSQGIRDRQTKLELAMAAPRHATPVPDTSKHFEVGNTTYQLNLRHLQRLEPVNQENLRRVERPPKQKIINELLEKKSAKPKDEYFKPIALPGTTKTQNFLSFQNSPALYLKLKYPSKKQKHKHSIPTANTITPREGNFPKNSPRKLDFQLLNEKSDLIQSARKIRKMRMTLNKLQDDVMKKIESSGQGQVPTSWRRKVSSPMGGSSESPSDYFMNSVSRLSGSQRRFGSSYREPNLAPNGSQLFQSIKQGESARRETAFLPGRRGTTANRIPASLGQTQRSILTTVPKTMRSRGQGGEVERKTSFFFDLSQKFKRLEMTVSQSTSSLALQEAGEREAALNLDFD